MVEWTKAALLAARVAAPGPLGLGLLIADPLIEYFTKSRKDLDEASQKGIEDLKLEAEKKNIIATFAERQAKISQELAIARRIETAEEVEIEEFFDASGSGALGLQGDLKKQTFNAGLSGDGHKVTRRIIRFKRHGTAPSRNDGAETLNSTDAMLALPETAEHSGEHAQPETEQA